MQAKTNDGGGKTLILTAGDSLSDVPQSHRDIITPEIRDAYKNPPEYFREIARQSQLKNFSSWLNDLIQRGSWSLRLADIYMMERDTVGAFRWSAPGIYGAMIEPGALPEVQQRNPGFSDPFSWIRMVHWDDVAHAGGLWGTGSEWFEYDSEAESDASDFPLVDSTGFGRTSCGDQFIYTKDGQAGFFSHEVSRAYSLGTIRDALEWIFGELHAGHEPAFDYSMLKSR
jgi:hypothetical protein